MEKDSNLQADLYAALSIDLLLRERDIETFELRTNRKSFETQWWNFALQ